MFLTAWSRWERERGDAIVDVEAVSVEFGREPIERVPVIEVKVGQASVRRGGDRMDRLPGKLQLIPEPTQQLGDLRFVANFATDDRAGRKHQFGCVSDSRMVAELEPNHTDHMVGDIEADGSGTLNRLGHDAEVRQLAPVTVGNVMSGDNSGPLRAALPDWPDTGGEVASAMTGGATSARRRTTANLLRVLLLIVLVVGAAAAGYAAGSRRSSAPSIDVTYASRSGPSPNALMRSPFGEITTAWVTASADNALTPATQ